MLSDDRKSGLYDVPSNNSCQKLSTWLVKSAATRAQRYRQIRRRQQCHKVCGGCHVYLYLSRRSHQVEPARTRRKRPKRSLSSTRSSSWCSRECTDADLICRGDGRVTQKSRGAGPSSIAASDILRHRSPEFALSRLLVPRQMQASVTLAMMLLSICLI